MNEINCSYLEKLGWGFMPCGPNEFKWIKFDKKDKQIAVQGDKIWKSDIKREMKSRKSPWRKGELGYKCLCGSDYCCKCGNLLPLESEARIYHQYEGHNVCDKCRYED